MDKNLKNFSYAQISELLASIGEKSYLGGYIFSFIHQKGVSDIEDISPLSKRLREKLAGAGYFISELKIAEKLQDADGTMKYVFDLGDGNFIESVLILDDSRVTVCASTQAGCGMGCSFCATAKIKFRRNLSCAEILDQLYLIERDGSKVSNVVYMGMGEPFANYDNVMASVGLLNSSKGRNLGIRHITISTCGLVDGIERFSREELKPRLAVSLNAANDKLRSEIMAVNRKYGLGELLVAVRDYQRLTGQRVTFEYVMMKGVNDSDDDAARLVRLVRGIRCNVNLIEYNAHPGCKYEASGAERIKSFAKVLESSRVEVVMRFKRGRGINAACGQLGSSRQNGGKTNRPD
ncbi:MAG: 23S rRNA (adenine(2503)-C(2))-methyltransferase RlmN [Phycisphaerae bacterium]|nr:23S rRNA (adenine(2503)-C(2))-methyltransferase RlmN [Phycisphaerae bacterium]